MIPGRCPRRSFLRTAGTSLALGAFLTTGVSSPTAADGSDPTIQWRRSYHGKEQEYKLEPRAFCQTTDGGYAIGGEGARIEQTAPERSQFGCLKTDATGEVEWIAFGLDDHEAELRVVTDIIELGDGGFVLIGMGNYHEESEPDAWDEPVARVIRFAADGSVEWTVVFDRYADQRDEALDVEDSPQFDALTASDSDDGVVAVGRQGMDGWAVKLAGDGSIEWRRRFDDDSQLTDAFAGGDDYRFHAVSDDRDRILHVDSNGRNTDETILDIDYEAIPHNHVVVPTMDGGYAITGRYDGRQRMVLQRVDASGNREWLETYNGPYDGYDWAYDLVQTEDAGFALFGQMDAAYTGNSVPAILKTDPDGIEEWRQLLDSEEHLAYRLGTQTSDGGFAAFNHGSRNFLVKYAVESTKDDGESSPADAETSPSSANETTIDPGREDDEPGASAARESTDATHNETVENSGTKFGSGPAEGTNDRIAGKSAADALPGFGLGTALAGIGGVIGYSAVGSSVRDVLSGDDARSDE